ncbi:MAG: hypothetical protein ACRDHX_05070, partial [Chloroflexota bacterium]
MLPLTDAARQRWVEVYPRLSADAAGLYGAVTARAEAHVLRLSLLYALLDCASAVDGSHLEAALSLWAYECSGCGVRLLGEQRCPDCGLFARRLGLGGLCPHCDEPVT